MSNIQCNKMKKRLEKKLSPTQIAKLMGVHIYSVYRWINQGELKSEKKGRCRYVLKKDYEQFIKSRS